MKVPLALNQPSLPAIEGALGLTIHRGDVRISLLDCRSGNLEILVHGIRFQALGGLQTHVHAILTSEMETKHTVESYTVDTDRTVVSLHQNSAANATTVFLLHLSTKDLPASIAIWVAFFCCTGPYTLGPCLRKRLRFRRLGAYAGASTDFFVGRSCTW